MVSFNLKVLAKFCLCSNCSQKLDGCSLARARKIFVTACQMLALAKINTLLACSQMLAKTILYPLKVYKDFEFTFWRPKTSRCFQSQMVNIILLLLRSWPFI